MNINPASMATNQPGEGQVTNPPIFNPDIARAHAIQMQIPSHLQQQQIVMVPAPSHYRHGRPWKHTLCSCTCDECVMSVFCPCLMAGHIWQKALGKSFRWGVVCFSCIFILGIFFEMVIATFTYIPIFASFWLFPVLYALLWTAPLRAQGGIAGEFCGDCCTCCWCGYCEIIREKREAEEMWDESQRNVAVPMQMI